MSISLVVIAVVIIISATVFGKSSTDESESIETAEPQQTTNEVKGASSDKEAVIETPNPTVLSTPISTPVPTAGSTVAPTQLSSEYVYPGATVISESDNRIEMQSSAGTDEITNWYSDKLKSLGMNVNTRVRTRANDKVLNKLVAVGTSKVAIEISQEDGSSLVTIIVSFE
jgi:hypothetical protein